MSQKRTQNLCVDKCVIFGVKDGSLECSLPLLSALWGTSVIALTMLGKVLLKVLNTCHFDDIMLLLFHCMSSHMFHVSKVNHLFYSRFQVGIFTFQTFLPCTSICLARMLNLNAKSKFRFRCLKVSITYTLAKAYSTSLKLSVAG